MAHGRGVWDEGVQAILRSFLNAVRLFLCAMSPKAILATKNHTARRQGMPSLEPVPRQRNGNVRVEMFDTLEQLQGVDTPDFNENYLPSLVQFFVRAREVQSMYWTQ